ncbi:hypothetical protein M0P48_01095 [Candidatus Gracilibacteria bacterium]|jgi:hypothetical protein|nr:hypothetical protein [Candidatus Gracilibacteria bacterium]
MDRNRTEEHGTLDLKNGGEVAKSIVTTTMIALRRLLDENPVAVYELVMKCRDPKHELFGDTGEVLKRYALIQGSGEVYSTVKDVVLSSVDEVNMKLVSPLLDARKSTVERVEGVVGEEGQNEADEKMLLVGGLKEGEFFMYPRDVIRRNEGQAYFSRRDHVDPKTGRAIIPVYDAGHGFRIVGEVVSELSPEEMEEMRAINSGLSGLKATYRHLQIDITHPGALIKRDSNALSLSIALKRLNSLIEMGEGENELYGIGRVNREIVPNMGEMNRLAILIQKLLEKLGTPARKEQ